MRMDANLQRALVKRVCYFVLPRQDLLCKKVVL